MPRPANDDGAVELQDVDVPAAVVCAICGEADCTGCQPEAQRTTMSGVVVFVPWERMTNGLWSRFWATTRATTAGAEAFFGQLPEGAISPAMSFAILAEAVATGSMIAAFASAFTFLLYELFPRFATLLLTSTETRVTIARMAGVAWVGFTAVLLLGHVLHAFFLDVLAQREGRPAKRARALRFGLYAAGWDVAQSPLGFVVAFFSGGPRAFAETFRHAVSTPSRATAAMLRGLYGLEPESSKGLRNKAIVLTMIPCTIAIIAAMAAIGAAAAWR